MIKNALLIIMALSFIHSKAQVEIGDKVPQFTLNDENSKPVKISDYIGSKNLVIYFYPKDDTPGCTKEACTFRDQREDFDAEDAVVIGISSDSEASHTAFKEKYELNFILLADVDGVVRKQFGVPTNLLGLIPGRVTYVIDKNGIIQYIFNSQTKPEKHIDESLKALKEINKNNK